MDFARTEQCRGTFLTIYAMTSRRDFLQTTGGALVAIACPPALAQTTAEAALPLVAALLRPGQPEMLAQRVEQRRASVELGGANGSVDAQAY